MKKLLALLLISTAASAASLTTTPTVVTCGANKVAAMNVKINCISATLPPNPVVGTYYTQFLVNGKSSNFTGNCTNVKITTDSKGTITATGDALGYAYIGTARPAATDFKFIFTIPKGSLGTCNETLTNYYGGGLVYSSGQLAVMQGSLSIVQ